MARNMPRRPLSVGARWAVQYSVAVLATFTLLAVYTYGEMRDRVKHDARLLLELQIAELREVFGEGVEPKELEAHVTLAVEIGESGAKLFRGDGHLDSSPGV